MRVSAFLTPVAIWIVIILDDLSGWWRVAAGSATLLFIGVGLIPERRMGHRWVTVAYVAAGVNGLVLFYFAESEYGYRSLQGIPMIALFIGFIAMSNRSADRHT